MARPDFKPEQNDRSAIANDREVAEYIASMLNELERMAATHGLVELSYHLRHARERAETFEAYR